MLLDFAETLAEQQSIAVAATCIDNRYMGRLRIQVPALSA